MPDNGRVAADRADSRSTGQAQALQVRLLGPFAVSLGGRTAGPWPRPSARRLCELVLVSPGRRVSRDLAGEELFGDLDPRAAARAVSKALSMARSTLAELGEPATTLLSADLGHIWAAPDAQIDAEAHTEALRTGLTMSPGRQRDDQLVAALAEEGDLLAGEPDAGWAVRPRERLTVLRQQARLALASDRVKGAGQSRSADVLAAWEACFRHDPACEEAAAALVRIYFGQQRRDLAVHTYARCTAALEELGLGIGEPLQEAYATAAFEAGHSAAAAHVPPPVANVPQHDELRTVSVLCAEVAAPAGPAGQLGPESLRDLVGGAVATVIAEVEALGGTVISVSGNGVQAVFGAPEANEDDPERAARAAFRALSAAAGEPPTLRIGIETGPAVLGPIGGGRNVAYGAVGAVVSTAALLASQARPGSALVGPATRATVGHLFSWDGSGPVPAGPHAGPLIATRLGTPRPRMVGRRSRLGGAGPLVGRHGELAALEAAVHEAARGDGSVVLVTGEPGLGKTRLVQECRRRVAAEPGHPARWLVGRCASYSSSTPYGLYQQLLANWAGVTPDQREAVLRPALERTLTEVPGAGDLYPWLARMMGLPAGAALGRRSPEELQRGIFAAWHSLVARLVAAGPAVLILEDLHWADPTSLRLTLDLAPLTAGRRLLILATTRPEAGPELAGLEHAAAAVSSIRRITLRPLPAEAERALARSLLGADAAQEIPSAALASVDGNPLFLEERLSSLLESRSLVREDGTWQMSESAGHDVPQALERLVRSRVDRLSPAARETVRLASVLGAEFPRALLTAMGTAEEPLATVLDELCASDLLREAAGRPEPTFRFRHALLQEAIYNGLLGSDRRLLHGRVAWALEAASAGRSEVAAVLGRHFAAAGEAECAVRYLEIAGDHAAGEFANDEAVSSFRAALAVVGDQPARMADAAVELRGKLANVLWRTGRRGEARQALSDALDLAGEGNILRRAHLQTRLGRLEMADLCYEAAEAAFDDAKEQLGEAGDGEAGDGEDPAAAEVWLELMVDGRAALYMMRGEYERTLAALEGIRPLLESAGSLARKYSFYMHLSYARVMANGHQVSDADLADMRLGLAAAADGAEEKDVGYATYFLARLLWLRGDLDAAQAHMEQALAMAERIGETILLGLCLLGLALTALRRGDIEVLRAWTHRALAVADDQAGPEYRAKASACLAWLAWHDHHSEEVIRLAGEIAELQVTGPRTGPPDRWVYLLPLLAARLDAGQLADAIATARQLADPARQSLPGALGSALQAAISAWERSRPGVARRNLGAVLALAHELRYL